MTRRLQVSSDQRMWKRQPESRKSFRVRVNKELVLELGVWFKQCGDFKRLTLKDLGSPLWFLGRPPYPSIDNLSAGGMALSFNAAREVDSSKLDNQGLLAMVYFKLSAVNTDLGGPISILAGYEVIRAKFQETKVLMGLRLTLNGLPLPGEMALEFTDVRKHGIPVLTKWCDDVFQRKSWVGVTNISAGIRLENLMHHF